VLRVPTLVGFFEARKDPTKVGTLYAVKSGHHLGRSRKLAQTGIPIHK